MGVDWLRHLRQRFPRPVDLLLYPLPQPLFHVFSSTLSGTATNAVVHATDQATKTIMCSEGLRFRRPGILFNWGGGGGGGW